jgi:hypothetical protein
MENITLQGEENYLTITFDEVYGFPKRTCHWGGYEVRTVLKIKSGNFQVTSTLYTSTGELYELFQQLKECNNKLAGIAKYRSYEGNLEFSATYDTMGHINIKGEFSEQNNDLKFEFLSDQTFITKTIQDLEIISEKYGDMLGVKK